MTSTGVADLPYGRAAWFKDSEDNILGLLQLTPAHLRELLWPIALASTSSSER